MLTLLFTPVRKTCAVSDQVDACRPVMMITLLPWTYKSFERMINLTIDN